MGRRALVIGLGLVLLLAGCSSSGDRPARHTTSPVSSPSSSAPADFTRCPASFGAALGAATDSPVSTTADRSSGLIVCHLHARSPHRGTCSAAKVSINTGPQAFTDFRRWVDESVQNATEPDLAPRLVPGIGLAADWIPGDLNLEAGRMDRWVAVFLTCPSGGKPALHLATTLAKAAMAARP